MGNAPPLVASLPPFPRRGHWSDGPIICIQCHYMPVFGPSGHLPLRGRTKEGVHFSSVARLACFPRPSGRFYGFLNDYGIPLSFRKPYNLASLVKDLTTGLRPWEMHPLWCLRHHLSPRGGTGPMDPSLSDEAIFKETFDRSIRPSPPLGEMPKAEGVYFLGR